MSVLWYFVSNVQPGPAFWIGWAFTVAGGSACLVVAGGLVFNWYADYSLAR